MQSHAAHALGGFLPHGYCYRWNVPLLATHVGSDLLIGISYVAISFSLAFLVHRARRDIPFSLVFVAFGLFIVTCGLTHFVEVWTLWNPVYWLSGGVKVVTAAASVATAVAMPFTVPRVLLTVRDARLSREREVAAARADALEAQAVELRRQRAEAEALAEELAAANARLLAAVAAADAARAEAEEANRAKSEFLTTMSHELRTPLNAIGGYTELIEMGIRGPVTPAQREDLGRIRRAQGVLEGLINDVLNFARLERGQIEYHPREVPVRPLLDDLRALVAPMARARGVAYAQEGGDGAALRADPERVQQILTNLLTNAIKFTDAGGSVRVEAEARDGSVHIHVTDTGRGIAPAMLESVFDPFVQVDRHRTEQSQQGVGLGLAISRALAQGMGGDVSVRSEVGVGSRFTVTLPAWEPEQIR
jgi:signal transduction histidine kinase